MKLSLLELGDVRCRLAETFGDFCSDFWQLLQRLLANFAASFVQTQHFVLFTLKLKVVMIKI
jgi:hypothetical protein